MTKYKQVGQIKLKQPQHDRNFKKLNMINLNTLDMMIIKYHPSTFAGKMESVTAAHPLHK